MNGDDLSRLKVTALTDARGAAATVPGRGDLPPPGCLLASGAMDMLSGEQVTDAGLADWRKLGQGLHARFVVSDFRAGVRFLTEVSASDAGPSDHLEVRMGSGYVDLKLISHDAVYRDDTGAEHCVDWVTARDIELARAISAIAAEQSITADPASVIALELALDTADAAAVAPVWAVLLTGGTDAQGNGNLGDDVRDLSGRVPILWFQDTEAHPTPRQRFHLDLQLPYDVAADRIAAAVAAGATVVDDSRAPRTTVLADPDGNRACIGVFQPSA